MRVDSPACTQLAVMILCQVLTHDLTMIHVPLRHSAVTRFGHAYLCVWICLMSLDFLYVRQHLGIYKLISRNDILLVDH